MITPVKLAPGRFRLATRPSRTGSVPVANTTGTVVAAALAANAPAVFATITAACRLIRSATRDGSRSLRPSAQRSSIATFRFFDEADLGQPPAKCSHKVPRVGGRRVAQKPNHRHPLALLRTRRNRPGRRPAEQGDELATPHHSITSSARASSVGGTSRPSALAILRLITSSYLLGACTGRSAGFSPLRMRST